MESLGIVLLQLLITQLGDILWISARVKLIRSAVEQIFLKIVDEYTVRALHGSLHLVIHDTFVQQLVVHKV